MYCDKIAIGVEHWVRGRARKDPFFVVSCNWHEAMQIVGELYMNEHEFRAYIAWALHAPDDDSYLVLVSLDMKYGLIRKEEELYGIPQEYEFFYFQPAGDAVFGSFDGIKYAFDEAVKREPFIADKVGYRPTSRAIPKRLKFDDIRQNFAPGDIDREVREAMRNPEGASDDALVWLAIVGPNHFEGFGGFDYKRVMSELQMRIEKGADYRFTFFPTSRVTMTEVQARAARARKTYRKFVDKFEYLKFHDHNAIALWVKKLDGDVLAELTVYAFYSDVQGTGHWKFFLGELQGRYPGVNRD